MYEPQGRVISLSGRDTDRHALVDVDATVFCSRCREGKGCGAGLFGQSERQRRVEVEIPAGVDIEPGDLVSISLAPRNVLRAAAIVYGWPLLGAAAGAMLAYAGSYGDAAAAASALAGLAGGAMLVRYRLRQQRCLRQFTPRIIA